MLVEAKSERVARVEQGLARLKLAPSPPVSKATRPCRS